MAKYAGDADIRIMMNNQTRYINSMISHVTNMSWLDNGRAQVWAESAFRMWARGEITLLTLMLFCREIIGAMDRGSRPDLEIQNYILDIATSARMRAKLLALL